MMLKYLVLLVAHQLQYAIVGLFSYQLPHFLPLSAACYSWGEVLAHSVPELLFALQNWTLSVETWCHISHPHSLMKGKEMVSSKN